MKFLKIIGLLVVGIIALGMVLAAFGVGDEPAKSNKAESHPSVTATVKKAKPTVRKPAPAKPKATHKPKVTPKPKAVPKPILVTRAVDGDTVELSNGKVVRVVGIDTPERGQCGYREASDNMQAWAAGKRVSLVKTGSTDHDRYGRILRYVVVSGRDLGLRQIQSGRAIARYDSRDGYGAHPRERQYIAADAASPNKNRCAKPKPAKHTTFYDNCDAVKAAGAAPIHRGDAGYSGDLDRDGDGVACES